MTHLEVGKLGRRSITTGSFWLPNSYYTNLTDEFGLFKLYRVQVRQLEWWNSCSGAKNCRLWDCVVPTSLLPNASFVVDQAFTTPTLQVGPYKLDNPLQLLPLHSYSYDGGKETPLVICVTNPPFLFWRTRVLLNRHRLCSIHSCSYILLLQFCNFSFTVTTTVTLTFLQLRNQRIYSLFQNINQNTTTIQRVKG